VQPDCRPLPSIVVCPPTVTGHWLYEIDKFIGREYLNPLHYIGAPMDRLRLVLLSGFVGTRVNLLR